jgi:hypothetical protein
MGEIPQARMQITNADPMARERAFRNALSGTGMICSVREQGVI